mgnify:FL=1
MMPSVKIAVTIDQATLHEVDQLVKARMFPNRSQAFQSALAEKLARLRRTRLATECARLDPAEEQRQADEGLALDRAAWPEY